MCRPLKRLVSTVSHDQIRVIIAYAPLWVRMMEIGLTFTGMEVCMAADDEVDPATNTSDLDSKLELISKSYWEVLDATKHQDDKIGRMLTSVAFLTAATLALAALASASFVTRKFDVPPFVLPLGLITLTVFLVGVVFTVMLLLTSLATPLRLPGLAKPKGRRRMNWVREVPSSQLYFYEIAGVAVGEWERKWRATADDLKRERFISLIRETHNLADRTNTKYDRTTEAAALLSLSLLAFALAIIFVTIAAGSAPGQRPIHLNALSRVIVGGVIGSYCGLQLLARIRYARQSIDETEPEDDKSRVRCRLWGDRAFAVLFPAVLIDIVIGGSGRFLPMWILLTILLGLANVVSFWFATYPDKKDTTSLSGESTAANPNETAERRRSRRIWLHRGTMTAVMAALISLAVVSGSNGWYAGQLGVVSTAILGLITVSVLGPTLTMAARRRDLRIRLAKGRQTSSASAPHVENLSSAPEDPP